MKLSEVLTEDFLREHYWDNEESLQEIADMFGVTSSHIHYHMKKHDIPRRSCTEPTERTRQKQSTVKKALFQRGDMVPWNLGKPRTEETKKKASQTLKKRYRAGQIVPHNKGKRGLYSWTEEQRKNHSEKMRGRKHTQEHVRKRMKAYKEWYLENPDAFSGKNNHFFGKKHTVESRRKMSLSRLGEKNHRWLGGSSYKDYPLEFNEVLKKEIRERDNYICNICGKYGNVVHHINYDKNDNQTTNLIIVCRKDHIITNSNREHWVEYFHKLCRVIA